MNPKQNPARPTEIPPDVEARYKAIQAEMAQLQLSPQAVAGESREARYARQQRLRKLRREFDAASRYPLARRQRSGATTVVLMASIGILLCMLSIGGGAIVNNLLNRPADISGTITEFMDDIKAQDYFAAHGLLLGAQDLQSFKGTASQADQAMGPVTKYVQTGQQGGNSGSFTATVTFTVTRAGNSDDSSGYTKRPAASYPSIVIILNYINGQWQIEDVGNLFQVPDSTTPTPATAPTPSPTKGK